MVPKTTSSTQAEYNTHIRKKRMFLISLIFILIATALLSICTGSSNLTIAQVVKALLGSGDQGSQIIVWNVRMPRIAAGIAVGLSLSMAGCIMQNTLRNPLASSSTLGVSQGAAFGAALAIVCFEAGTQIGAGASSAITVTNPYLVTIFAFLGGITTTALILLLSRLSGVTPPVMILAGVAISAMFAGATTLLQYFTDDMKIASIVYWTFGNLGRASPREILVIFSLGIAAFTYFILNRWNYNAMESGTHTAKSLGVNVDNLILAGMVVSTLISSVSIAFVGTINFVGLISPHIARRFVGNDYRFLLPCSALIGGAILLWADITSRILAPPAVLPIGAITSFLGAPLFLYIIVRERL